MRAKQDGGATLFHGVDAVERLAGKLAIAHGQGFVYDQDVRIDAGGQRKRQPHEHAAGVGFDGLVNEMPDAREINDIAQAVLELCTADAQQWPIEQQVLPARKIGVETCPQLEQRSHTAVDLHAARAGADRATQQLQQGGFARAVAADNAQHLATWDLQVHSLQGPEWLALRHRSREQRSAQTLQGVGAGTVCLAQTSGLNGKGGRYGHGRC